MKNSRKPLVLEVVLASEEQKEKKKRKSKVRSNAVKVNIKGEEYLCCIRYGTDCTTPDVCA